MHCQSGRAELDVAHLPKVWFLVNEMDVSGDDSLPLAT